MATTGAGSLYHAADFGIKAHGTGLPPGSGQARSIACPYDIGAGVGAVGADIRADIRAIGAAVL
jgi:hypothetical protein